MQVFKVRNDKRRLFEEYSEEAVIFYPGKPPRNKKRKGVSSSGTSIQELPDDVLTLILECAWQGSRNEKLAAGRQRRVCKRWRKLVNCRAKSVSLERVLGDVDCSLRALGSFTTATQVKLRLSGRPYEEPLLQGLATGFSHVRAFNFTFIEEGWRALPGLSHFVFQKTSLEELSLSFPSFEETHGKTRALMEQMDFSSLVHLKTLTLHYGEDWFAKEGDCLPLSRSILALPQLQAFHLHVYDMRHLPPWLGELRAFASLSVNVAHVDQKPFDPAPLRTLQALELLTVFRLEPTVVATIVHALPALTSLQSNRFMNMPESNRGGYQAGALLLRPGLRRLHLSAPELPPLRSPQAELADLWLRVSEQASLQRDLFAFMPALQHLHLDLFSTYSLPDFRRLPAGLASLTLKTAVRWPAGDSECAVDIRHLSALQKLHLSCGVLPALVGLPPFDGRHRRDSSRSEGGSGGSGGSSTSSGSSGAGSSGRCQVTVSCACHADEHTPWMEEYTSQYYCSRFFKRYRQYAGDVHPCRFMPLGMARQLFPDAGPLLLPPAGPEASAQPDSDAVMATLPQARQLEEGEGTPEHAGVPPPRRLATAGAPAISATRGPVNRRDEVASWRMLVEDLQARAEVARGESARAHAEAVDSLEFAQSIVRTLEGERSGDAHAAGLTREAESERATAEEPRQKLQTRRRARRRLAAHLQSGSPRAPAAGVGGSGSGSSRAEKRGRGEALPARASGCARKRVRADPGKACG